MQNIPYASGTKMSPVGLVPTVFKWYEGKVDKFNTLNRTIAELCTNDIMQIAASAGRAYLLYMALGVIMRQKSSKLVFWQSLAPVLKNGHERYVTNAVTSTCEPKSELAKFHQLRFQLQLRPKLPTLTDSDSAALLITLPYLSVFRILKATMFMFMFIVVEHQQASCPLGAVTQ